MKPKVLQKILIFSILYLLLPASAFAGKIFNNPLRPDVTSNSFTANNVFFDDLVARIVVILLSLLGIISVASIIFSGVRIALARGNQDMVKKGTAGLVWAVIGLLVAFLGFVLVNFVLGQLTFLST